MDYSVFAKIIDLSVYNLEEIKKIASSMDMNIIQVDQHQTIEWSDENTSITIEFHLDGRFNRIVREVWKNLN
jgi:hypothetical protein